MTLPTPIFQPFLCSYRGGYSNPGRYGGFFRVLDSYETIIITKKLLVKFATKVENVSFYTFLIHVLCKNSHFRHLTAYLSVTSTMGLPVQASGIWMCSSEQTVGAVSSM